MDESLTVQTTPGLLKAYVVHRDEHQVVVNEEWDISVPGCPIIRNPWLTGLSAPQDDHYIRQLVMTPRDFEQYWGFSLSTPDRPNDRQKD